MRKSRPRSGGTFDSVPEALENFEVFHSRTLRWTVRIIPWAVLLSLVMIAHDPLYSSAMAAAALTPILFQLLSRQCSITLLVLWSIGVVPSDSGTSRTTSSQTTDSPLIAYLSFIGRFGIWLNHWGQWAFAALIGLLSIAWRIGSSSGEEWRGPTFNQHFIFVDVRVFVEVLVGALVGLIAWRMVVIGLMVWGMGANLGVDPQPGHPDRCSGLGSVGTLCLLNPFIATLAGLFLGTWLTIFTVFEHSDVAHSYSGEFDLYRPLFSGGLGIAILVVATGFFAPVFRVHQVMKSVRD